MEQITNWMNYVQTHATPLLILGFAIFFFIGFIIVAFQAWLNSFSPPEAKTREEEEYLRERYKRNAKVNLYIALISGVIALFTWFFFL